MRHSTASAARFTAASTAFLSSPWNFPRTQSAISQAGWGFWPTPTLLNPVVTLDDVKVLLNLVERTAQELLTQ